MSTMFHTVVAFVLPGLVLTCCNVTLRLDDYYNQINYVELGGFSVSEGSSGTEFVWIYVLIGLACLLVMIGLIVCCVYCIKGCKADCQKVGPAVVNPVQPAQGAVFVTTTSQQGKNPVQKQQPEQAVYPPEPAAPSGIPGPGGNIAPPSYDSTGGQVV